MRKNLAKHTAKKLPLAKRVLALCFALIFVCSCLLPAFANGTGVELDTPDTEVVEAADPGTEPEPMDLYDEPAAMDDDFAVADEPAAMDDQVEKPVVDDEPAAMDNEVEKPVEGGEPPVADDTPAEEGATKTTTDASGNIVYEYDTSGTTFPEDDAAALPDGDQVLDQMDAAFSIPTNIYHFWLKKMSSYDLADIATDAETAEMTVEQYLAMYGTDKGCYHIMTAADGANLKDYQFANPTSNDDPEGNSRTFAGWYYTDELGEEQKFVFDEFLYISEGTTVEVYAKWKEEPKTVKADAELNNVLDVTVQVDGLIGVDSLKVNQLDEYDEVDLADAIEDKIDTEKNIDLYTFELKPVDKNGDEVEPESGKKATVTIKGFDILSTDTIKVFHKTNLEVEDLSNTAKLDADGNLTFKTESFSPFAVVVEREVEYSDDLEGESEGGIALMSLPGDGGADADVKINLNAWLTLDGTKGTNHRWTSENTNLVWIKSYKNNVAVIASSLWKHGTTVVTHTYKDASGAQQTETIRVTVLNTTDKRGDGETYDNIPATIFILKSPNGNPEATDIDSWGYGVLGATVDGGKVLPFSTSSKASYVVDPQSNGYTLLPPRGWETVKVTNSNGNEVDAWEMPRDTDGFDYDSRGKQTIKMYEQVLNAYRSTLPDIPGVDKSKITADDVTIYVVPYKLIQWDGNASAGGSLGISGTELTALHIDSQIIVKYKYAYTANFYIKDVDAANHTLVSSKNYYRSADKLTVTPVPNNNGYTYADGFTSQYDSTQYPKTKTVDGITYELKYWYKDSSGTGTAISDNGFPYEPNDSEIEFGVINFYAEYVPTTSNVTISKTVKGLFGDRSKEFSFRIDGNLGSGVEVVKNDAVFARGSFTLKHGESVEVKGVPLNTTFTIVETCSEDYDTTATGYPDKSTDSERSFSYMLVLENDEIVLKTVDTSGNAHETVEDNAIEVVNEYDAPVDNGVLLDTLPYILILVVVAGGGVLLFLRKRKNDDDE